MTKANSGAGRGRPSKYDPDKAAEILDLLAKGLTLKEICRRDGMPPSSTVRSWALDDREGFFAPYARAREIGCYELVDEIIEIADDAQNDWMERNAQGDEKAGWQINHEHVQRSRLRIDTRKWVASKVLPKVFGDKVELGDESLEQLVSRLNESRNSARSNV